MRAAPIPTKNNVMGLTHRVARAVISNGESLVHVRARLFALALLAMAPAGCGGGGFLGSSYTPNGNITLSSASSGQDYRSSLASPFVVGVPGFTVVANEQYFQGPYTAKIVSWNNGFNEPCYGISATQNYGSNQVNNEFTVSAVNAPTAGTPQDQNPCVALTDEETLQVSDTKGHSAFLYFTYST